MQELCPYAVQNKGIWLPCEIIMIPPRVLLSRGVIVQRHVQNEGEYVIVYPKTYCACICTGYTISEGVYFAPHSFLDNIETIYRVSLMPVIIFLFFYVHIVYLKLVWDFNMNCFSHNFYILCLLKYKIFVIFFNGL